MWLKCIQNQSGDASSDYVTIGRVYRKMSGPDTIRRWGAESTIVRLEANDRGDHWWVPRDCFIRVPMPDEFKSKVLVPVPGKELFGV